MSNNNCLDQKSPLFETLENRAISFIVDVLTLYQVLGLVLSDPRRSERSCTRYRYDVSIIWGVVSMCSCVSQFFIPFLVRFLTASFACFMRTTSPIYIRVLRIIH